MIDLLEGRINVAEATMANLQAAGVYSDGTGSGGKEMTGLAAAVPLNPATGVYGGIDRVTWNFWRSQASAPAGALTPTTIQAAMNDLWAKLVRGSDMPDLIPMDSFMWGIYVASLQAQQRFTEPTVGNLGFPTLKYMGTADVGRYR